MTNIYLIFILSFIIVEMKQNVVAFDSEKKEFVAMEYMGLSNHIYKVIITDQHIVGLEVNGYISVANIADAGTTVKRADIKNPEAYIDEQMSLKYSEIDIDQADLLSMNSRNFRIRRDEVSSVKLSSKKKFGMGYYPYSGRIILKSPKTVENAKKKRDLILIGEQDRISIIDALKKKIDNFR